MFTDEEKDRLRNRLHSIVEARGADMSRWPREDLDLLRPFIDDDAQARDFLAEEVAFDQLLGQSQASASVASDKLKARIMSAARGEPLGGATVIDFPLQEASKITPRGVSQFLPVSSLLAASLVLGLYLGATGQTNNSFAALIGESVSVAQTSNEQVLETALYLPSLSFESSVVGSEDFDEQ